MTMMKHFFSLFIQLSLSLVVVVPNVAFVDALCITVPPPGLAPVVVSMVLSLTSPVPLTTTPTPLPLPLPLPQSTNTIIINSSNNSNINDNRNVPVLEVIKVYGKLAGSECYGKQAPKGSSCQINLNDLKRTLSSSSSSSNGDDAGSDSIISKEEFGKLLNSMEFAWPLKPFGVDGSSSLMKTSVMNKGAETYVYMDELVKRGLYDPRNPTGPLPTSLRPKINELLQQEGILVGSNTNDNADNNNDTRVIDRTYDILLLLMKQLDDSNGGAESSTTSTSTSTTTQYLDYYNFLKLYDPNTISWPKY